MTSIETTGLAEFISATDALKQQSEMRRSMQQSSDSVADRLKNDMGRELARQEGRRFIHARDPFSIGDLQVSDGAGTGVFQDDRSSDQLRARPSIGERSVSGRTPAGIASSKKAGGRTFIDRGQRGGIAGAAKAFAQDQDHDFGTLISKSAEDFVLTLEAAWEEMAKRFSFSD